MNKIQEQWFMLEKFVVPETAPEIQRQEMRRAFYAGMMRLQWNKSISEDAGVAILEGCREETKTFATQVKNGDA